MMSRLNFSFNLMMMQLQNMLITVYEYTHKQYMYSSSITWHVSFAQNISTYILRAEVWTSSRYKNLHQNDIWVEVIMEFLKNKIGEILLNGWYWYLGWAYVSAGYVPIGIQVCCISIGIQYPKRDTRSGILAVELEISLSQYHNL